jgi:hypothetical protein
MKKIFVIFVLLGLFSPVFVSANLARQGCCSWHGGVSYCDTSIGIYVCRDGTHSPSCGCYKKPPESKANSIITEINKVKIDYYKSPNWFRENLINKLVSSLNTGRLLVASYVYTMLPDVK